MTLKIYLCAFLSKTYIKEAKVCIESIRKNGKFTGKIYLFTDMNVSIPGVDVIKVPCESIYLAASYRTRVFNHIKDLLPQDVVLYLDTDVVVLKPLPSFDNISNKINVYGYPNVTQEKSAFAGHITDDPKYTSKTAFSSGIMVFRPNKKIKILFNKIYKLYLELINQKKVNNCWEQPALCFTLIKYQMFNISLNDLVYEERTNEKIGNNIIFNHLCGMRSAERYNIMKKYL